MATQIWVSKELSSQLAERTWYATNRPSGEMRGPETDLKPSACSVSGTCATRQNASKLSSASARIRLLWPIFFFTPRFDCHRRTAEPEALTKLVGQVALVRKVQGAGSIGEEHE